MLVMRVCFGRRFAGALLPDAGSVSDSAATRRGTIAGLLA
jgi:hypothetical protein